MRIRLDGHRADRRQMARFWVARRESGWQLDGGTRGRFGPSSNRESKTQGDSLLHRHGERSPIYRATAKGSFRARRAGRMGSCPARVGGVPAVNSETKRGFATGMAVYETYDASVPTVDK